MNICNKKVVRKTIKSREKKQKSRERIIQILKEHPDYSARTEAGSSELIDIAHNGNTLLKLCYGASGLNSGVRGGSETY